MNYRAVVLSALFMVGSGLPTAANTVVSNIQIVKGSCGSTSHTAEGPLGSDLTKSQSRFYCDTVAITFFDDFPGHVLIDFSQKESQHSPILGFAGQIEVHQPGDVGTMMQVSNVYLESGQATAVNDGWCKFFFKGQQLSGIGCGMKVDEAGRRTVAVVTFDASPGQSLQSAGRPNLPINNEAETSADGAKILTLPNGNKVETLADGTTWAVIHPNGEMLAVQLDSTMPTDSSFHTTLIVNLLESDIVGAPQSERIQVEGDCQSRTYQIMGVLPYSEKNGGGMPDADSATEPEDVLRKVMPNTLMWDVFKVICKNP